MQENASTQVTRGAEVDAPAPTAALVERSEELQMLARMSDAAAERSVAPGTRRVYDSDWGVFEAWCRRYGAAALPADPETVRLFLTDLSLQVGRDGGFRYAPASMERFLASISRKHRDAGHPSPTRHPRVAEVHKGIRRQRGTAQRRVRPLLLDDLVRINASMTDRTWPHGVATGRDRLALLLGFATALRRNSLVALDFGDLTLEPDGLHVRLRRSKTDQEARGALLGVPYGTKVETCVPCAFVHWARLVAAPSRADRIRQMLAAPRAEHVCRSRDVAVARSLDQTPLLRSLTKGGDVLERRLTVSAMSAMVQRRIESAGYDPTPYGTHSLRAGFVTQARRNGASARDVRLQTLHGSDAMVDVYDRETRPLVESNAVWSLGL